jgi:hypothetical protein
MAREDQPGLRTYLRGIWIAAVFLLGSVLNPAWAQDQDSAQPVPPVTTGRVVATITTLQGAVEMPGVEVTLRQPEGGLIIAQTVTDGVGQVAFPDVPVGRYSILASQPGFVERESAVFTVEAGETSHVLLDTPLTFVLPEVQVRATDSVQPVSMSDILSGSLLESAPLEGDDFQSLLPLLPGVVRDADGRLRIKGGQPTQGALQVNSASLIDPSTGDFDLDLPAQSVESVEVLANPFAAEYGRFSTSVTQIRTRRGTNEWDVSTGNLVPRFRKFFTGIRGFEPRLSVHGPIKRDRLFFAQDFQFRYVATPVKSLPDEPDINLTSFDSFTRLDGVLSSRHMLGGGLILFPRELRHVTMNTFRPVETTPDLNQSGWATGVVDRLAISSDLVLESTVAARQFEINVDTENPAAMVYAPETQSGGFFNDQERDVSSVQWVEALTLSRDLWRGQHLFKFGTDLQQSSYRGESLSRPVQIRRLDGTLAEQIEFGGETEQHVSGLDVAAFAQDRWRLNSRVTFELGFRIDRDSVLQKVGWSPRAGVAIGVLPEGRGIVRGGFGRFVQRTPLNVGAFLSFEPRTVSRFEVDGATLGGPVTLAHRVDGELRTPEAHVGNVEWDQRFGRRFLLKLAFLGRTGRNEYILSPDSGGGALSLSSHGRSRYREFEATTRYLGGQRRDLTLSYVWSKGTADLNNYDQFYGNLRNPIVRVNEYNLIPTDVRHRLLLRGTVGLPGQWDFLPVLELRSGFPWSAVDEFQDFVGPRNQAGRLPTVRTLDFSIARPWRFKKYRFRAGLKVYNLFGDAAERDIQNNIASPSFGTAFNPVERSIGFVLGSAR